MTCVWAFLLGYGFGSLVMWLLVRSWDEPEIESGECTEALDNASWAILHGQGIKPEDMEKRF